MGSVYLAVRTEDDFDHKVAIKIIRENKATAQNILRFEQERRILAKLNHKGIGQLFGGGIAKDGYPYLIMEYIDGIPIDQYCQQKNLQLDERISLFKKVLEAVRHAHENLVIHRDLKPGNILITKTGEVKILDFGISKLLENPDSSVALTQTNTRLLTPKYAAPEQVLQKPVTTATDLYALGIIFYQLLTNIHPIDLDTPSQYELERRIIEQHPSPPSAIIFAPFSISAKQLKGDLDAIALKALRKEPNQRYRVANEFLEDLKNYEQKLPVSALNNSWRYRSQKFLKRHQKAIGISIVLFLTSFMFGIFYTYRITKARNKAQLEAQRAEEVTNFMISLFRKNNPRQSKGKNITIGEAMDRAYQKINKQNLSPINQATVLGIIGEIQSNLGEIEKSGDALKKALPIVLDSVKKQTSNSIDILSSYASWNIETGNWETAEQYFKMADSLYLQNEFQKTDSYFINKINMADLYNQRGEYAVALKVLDAVEYLLPNLKERPILLTSYYYNDKGIAYAGLQEFSQSFGNYEKSLHLKEQIYDSDNPELGQSYHNIASLYIRQHRNKRAYELYQKAYKIRKNAYGQDHPLLASTLNGFGISAERLGKLKESRKYFEESIRILKKQYGTNHYRYALGLRNYADLLTQEGEYKKAIKNLLEAETIIGKTLGYDHLYCGYINASKAELLKKTVHPQKALQSYQKAISIFFDKIGNESLKAASILTKKGALELKTENSGSAIASLNKSRQIYLAKFDTMSVGYGKNLFFLGKYYIEKDRKLCQSYLEHAQTVLSKVKSDTFALAFKADSLLSSL